MEHIFSCLIKNNFLKKKIINLFKESFIKLYIFIRQKKPINNVSIKSFTFQTGQINCDGGEYVIINACQPVWVIWKKLSST